MIDVKKFVAVSGMSGVQKLINVRNNGLIIENFDTKKREFVPVRTHQFSPFETISVYTDTTEGSVALAAILSTMKAQAADNPPPSDKSPSDELRDYFISILPEHDRDRVHTSDIKKIIKWYNFLNSRDLLKEAEVEVEETVAETETEEADTTVSEK
jgi:hypothetical protein